jgi:hypothetical protein
MTAQSRTYSPPPALGRIRAAALLLGAAGAVLAVIGGLGDREQFYRSYLVGYIFWLAIPFGCLGILMLHHLTGGGWGILIRRVLEAGASTLPLIVLLGVPVVLGLHHLYEWAQPEHVAHDALLQHKAAYLNARSFALRAVGYAALLGLLIFLLSRWSSAQDATGDPGFRKKMRNLSAPGLIVYALVASFFAIDWMMSLEPHWFSSIYGIYFIGTTGLAAIAFAILVAAFLAGREPLATAFRRKHFFDYGNLMFAFVMLWAYFSVSQLIIIWSGNLPEEITWYVHRMKGGWRNLALGLAILHFALPFVLLITRTAKGSIRILAGIAALVLAMRWVDYLWQLRPPFHEVGPPFHWIDLAVVLGIGGLWVAFFMTLLGRRPLLPVNDPQTREVLGHA